jgi:hypothetical protein
LPELPPVPPLLVVEQAAASSASAATATTSRPARLVLPVRVRIPATSSIPAPGRPIDGSTGLVLLARIAPGVSRVVTVSAHLSSRPAGIIGYLVAVVRNGCGVGDIAETGAERSLRRTAVN